jgi:hypothetical protein
LKGQTKLSLASAPTLRLRASAVYNFSPQRRKVGAEIKRIFGQFFYLVLFSQPRRLMSSDINKGRMPSIDKPKREDEEASPVLF